MRAQGSQYGSLLYLSIGGCGGSLMGAVLADVLNGSLTSRMANATMNDAWKLVVKENRWPVRVSGDETTAELRQRIVERLTGKRP